MKQLIGRSDSVVVTRMPLPALGPRDVLVRNAFSLVSTGTEIAGMTAATGVAGSGAAARSLYGLVESGPLDRAAWSAFGDGKVLQRGPGGAASAETSNAAIFATGSSEYGYAATSPGFTLVPDARHVVSLRVRVLSGNVSCGVMDARTGAWIVTQAFPYARPELRFTLSHDVSAGHPIEARIVVSNHRPGLAEASSFEIVEATHHRWERLPAEFEEDLNVATGAPEERLTTEQRLKRSVKRLLARVTGQENSWQEQTLKRWYGKLTGDPILANTRVVRGRDLPSDEMSHQGWFLGYSSAGEVIAKGSEVTEVAVGDLVACAGAGRANHAEVVSVPVMLTAKLPPGVDCRSGCSATVGAIAMQGVRRAKVEIGHRVVVIGLGLIGQITVQILKAAGCRVLGFDLQAERVERARQSGLDDGANSESEITALVNRWTGEQGADAVIVTAATKSDAPINLAMKLARRRGTVIVSGDVALSPQRGDFYRKEIDFGLATSYGPGRYDSSYEDEGRDYPYGFVRWTANRNLQSYLELVATGAVDFLGLIEAEADLCDAREAYAQLVAAPVKPLAVVLRYGGAVSSENEVPIDPVVAATALAEDIARTRTRVDLAGGAPLRNAASKGPVNVVLVGAGGFAQGMLAPKMLDEPQLFQLVGVVSRHGAAGSNFARSIGVSGVASEMTGFLGDPAVGAFVIATRHHEHAGQVVAALRAGKHVFVEKPFALDVAQLGEIVRVASSLSVPPVVMVGFNRRFSPAIRTLREAIAHRSSPVMVNYRVNAGRVPLNSWLQGREGGGRNIGEACHMYDLFRALTGARAVDVRATSLGSRPSDSLANDNFCATIRYEDGSLCTLTYSAQGPKQGLAKERIEVFCGGEAWILDDFTRLTKAGVDAALWEGAVDKGHAEELRRFGRAIIDGGPAPIAFDELVETTLVSFAVEEQL